jgi:dihydroorotate dehydrogenase electron transfer subunit
MGQGHEITEQATLIRNLEIGPRLYCLTLEAPRLAAASPPEPGQFVHVLAGRGHEQFLRRPISVLDFDAARARLELYVQVFGPGSQRIIETREGESINVLGSLGRSFAPHDPGSTLYMIAGGVGLAPLYFWARRLCGRDADAVAPRIELLLGARSSREIPRGGLLEDLPVTPRFATEDGSVGFRGTVIALLDSLLDGHVGPVELAGCGPLGMLAALEALALRRGVRVQVCMEQVMGCAMGACQGCVVPARLKERKSGSGDGYARVCTEGPVFEGGEVDWNALVRQGHHVRVPA